MKQLRPTQKAAYLFLFMVLAIALLVVAAPFVQKAITDPTAQTVLFVVYLAGSGLCIWVGLE